MGAEYAPSWAQISGQSLADHCADVIRKTVLIVQLAYFRAESIPSSSVYDQKACWGASALSRVNPSLDVHQQRKYVLHCVIGRLAWLAGAPPIFGFPWPTAERHGPTPRYALEPPGSQPSSSWRLFAIAAARTTRSIYFRF